MSLPLYFSIWTLWIYQLLISDRNNVHQSAGPVYCSELLGSHAVRCFRAPKSPLAENKHSLFCDPIILFLPGLYLGDVEGSE